MISYRMKEAAQFVPNTAQEARGRAISGLFFTGFGGVWAVLGVQGMGWGAVPVLLGLGAVIAALLGMVAVALRRSRELPLADGSLEGERRAVLMVRAVNIILWMSIATAVAILAILHMPEYVVAAVAMLVGVHLLPLAETFRFRRYYLTGSLLVAWSLGALALVPREHVSTVAALGSGVILLVSAAWALMGSLSSSEAVASVRI